MGLKAILITAGIILLKILAILFFRKHFRKIKGTKQHDITDCGAACIASVASHYKLNLPISRIRQMTSTDKKGTNVLGMVEGATKLGFLAKGVKGQFESLFKIPKPAIAHVVLKNGLHHFVVVYGIDQKHIKIMDPAFGEVKNYEHEEFKAIWSGVLVLLVPGKEFKPANLKESVISKFIKLLAPHKTVMTEALFGAVIFSLMGLATSFYVQKVIDYVLVDGNVNLLNLLSIALLCFLLVRFFIGIMKHFSFKNRSKDRCSFDNGLL